MTSQNAGFEVCLTLEKPKFKKERRFLFTETEYVKRQLEAAQQPSWWARILSPKMGFYTRQDWEHYLHELQKYAHQLDKHEQEIDNGLIPFKVYVTNTGGQPDSNIRIRILVENGEIHDKKKPPKRPDRLDKTNDGISKPKLSGFSKFTRREVHITKHRIEAEFSYLDAQDGAELVRQVLYVAADPETRFFYEISSDNVEKARGEAEYLF